eukprot:15336226-Ditylum_brightwellii.AAC.1
MGDQIVMMGDINKCIHLDNITKWAEEMGMRELITDKHGRDGPATTQGKGGQQAIDGIWGMAGVCIQEGGYLPLHKRIKSNYRLIWIKPSLVYTLGSKDAATKIIPSRLLTMEDKQGQRQYKKIVRAFLK